MQIDFGPLLKQIIELVLAFAVASVIPFLVKFIVDFLKARIASIKNKQIQDAVFLVVRAALQMIPDKNDRYAYAARMIHAKFPKLSEEQIRVMIEAAVLSLKQELGEVRSFPIAVPSPPA